MKYKAKVFYDGLGGIAIIDACETVREYCKVDGTPETFDTKLVIEPGLYEIELYGYHDHCDHNNDVYFVMEPLSAVKISDEVVPA